MSMFWGLSMKPNRKYSQTIVKSFHLSSIALDEGESAKLYLTADKQKYVVGTVSKSSPQVMLDLNFSKGDKIIFHTTGDATVSLLGYLHDTELLDDYDDDDDGESTDEQEYVKTGNGDEEGDEDDEDEEDDEDVDDSQIINEYRSSANFSSGEEEEEESAEGESDGNESEEDSEEESDSEPKPKAKKAKLDSNDKKKAKPQNGVAKNDPKHKTFEQKPAATPAKADNKKVQQKAKEGKQPAAGERSLAGGVKVEDVRTGNGTEAKQGKRVAVYYTGRLKSNNKMFDSMQKGPGFKFALGAGEVIKGWDVGVAGMKVGGKRRITCPPHMAYGARGSPPTIPPNSTLVFDVELKGVH